MKPRRASFRSSCRSPGITTSSAAPTSSRSCTPPAASRARRHPARGAHRHGRHRQNPARGRIRPPIQGRLPGRHLLDQRGRAAGARPGPDRQPGTSPSSRTSSGRAARAAFDELKCRPGALLVFDNLEDPAQLARPVGAEASLLTLGCRILFTTRQRELGRFQPIEVSVLPEGPALQLLLRDDSRHPVRDDPRPPGAPPGQGGLPDARLSPARPRARQRLPRRVA